MRLFDHRCEIALLVIALLCCGSRVILASSVTLSVASSSSFVLPTVTSLPIGTCASRSINYITHGLPQICLRYSRTDSPSLENLQATARDETTPTPPGTTNLPADSGTKAEEPGNADLNSGSALDDSTFLSFEDWKRQTLEKEALLDPNTGERRAQVSKDGERKRNSDGIQDALKALEEDVVIDTDFTAFLGERSRGPTLTSSQGEEGPTNPVLQEVPEDKPADGNRGFHSKDAGKTCKERFNFASLDAGGQVMKTNPEAKSASALLREDRDVYMLNTCQAKNKFLIVELSESILVETIAIANFEFFSSTLRQFRVSVSDRYPVKLDRWVDLGGFEAMNSRDIQAFLVQDPRIWARYLRVEFLSHYGNEFYCPISLLRVHGRTMIQDVLGMEELTPGEDDVEDGLEDLSEGNGETFTSETITKVLEEDDKVTVGLREAEAALEELVKTAESIIPSRRKEPVNSSQIIEAKQWLEDVSIEQTTTPWIRGKSVPATMFEPSRRNDICLQSEGPMSLTLRFPKPSTEIFFAGGSPQSRKSGPTLSDASASFVALKPTGVDRKETTEGSQLPETPNSTLAFATAASTLKESTISQLTSAPGNVVDMTSTISKSLDKTSPTSASLSPQPTTQESFFKTVTKRLQLLEANSTLSLKYIEEQSRILRDAFTKVEKKQLSKTTSFLENLNNTVLEELRKFSQQYDQIWQSTIVELKTQRDQSQREIAAVSTRLSMLAEELLFQKRMSIVQSVLLLLCLGLVVFSRSSAAEYLDVPIIQSMVARSRDALDLPVGSVLASPFTHRVGASMRDRAWPGSDHRRQRSDDSAGSLRSASRDYSPPTPFSTYSRQEESARQDYGQNELLKGIRSSIIGALSTKHDLPPSDEASDPGRGQEPDINPEQESYPDFRNSALWLAPDSVMPYRDDQQQCGESLHGEEEQIMINDTNNPGLDTTVNGNDVEDKIPHITEVQGTTRVAYLPSPPPEREKPEFSIARKPLPALPKEDR